MTNPDKSIISILANQRNKTFSAELLIGNEKLLIDVPGKSVVTVKMK